MKKFGLLITVLAMAMMLLSACGGGTSDQKDNNSNNGSTTPSTNDDQPKDKIKIGMVTDTGGVDDKSFNQAAWEGIQAFGEANGLVENTDYKYLQSISDADYDTNLAQFVQGNFDITFATGYKLKAAMEKVAKANPDVNFAIIDEYVDLPNVTSATFKDQEGSFLVGIVAALTTETNTVGFIGGEESELMKRFEAGFEAGVKTINPKAEVLVQYANSYSDAAKGAAIASTMYGKQADVIYVAAGGTGNGVFTEAKNRKANGENVWVIGVDRDQYEEGLPENVTLTSMVKGVGAAVQQISTLTKNNELKGGQIEFGLADGGVGIAETTDNVGEDALQQVKNYEEKIISGEIIVPKTAKDLEIYLNGLK